MSKKENVCCVIVTYNGTDNVEKQVREYSEISKLIIIDNGSKVDYVSFLESLVTKYDFKLVLNGKNLGLSRALNQGLEYAYSNGCKYLLTLDQDSFLENSNLEKMISELESDCKLASVGPYFKQQNETQYVNYLITSGNLVLTDIIKNIGGYDEELFIDNIDIELSFRLIVNGYKLAQVKNTQIIHKIGEPEKSRIFRIKYYSHSPERFYWMYRNERYLIRKYYHSLKKLCIKSYFASVLMVLKVIFIERYKLAKLKKIFKGWKDGKRIKI